MTIALLIGGLLLCIILSAFFSASEMSFSSCSKLRIENLKDAGEKKAIKANKILEKFDDALGAILIGNNLVNIAASSLGSILIIEIFGNDKLAWLSTLVITIMVIIFGETIPKIIAKKRATHMALSFAYPIRFLEIILTPIIKFVVFIINLMTKNMRTEEEDVDEDDAIDEAIEELSSIIETAEDEDVLDEDQSDLIQAAIDFLDVSAVEVMTSRVDLVSIDIDDDPKDIEKIIFESGCSRIPVYKDSIDNIIGILYTNRYLKARTESESVDISNMLMEPLYVYKATRLTSVLDQLREKQIHLAIVCDEYGGTTGVVTMEDILEEIVGDIWDETDEIEEDVKELSETKFEVDGDLAISDFCELVDIDEDEFEAESETVGGWALEHFETYPENGDSFEDEGLKVKILSIEDRRIEKLYIEKLESEEESEE